MEARNDEGTRDGGRASGRVASFARLLLLASVGVPGLAATWLWACERWREGGPGWLVAFVVVPYAAAASAWRAWLAPGWRSSVVLVAVLIFGSVAIEVWSPYPRRWTFASWEALRALSLLGAFGLADRFAWGERAGLPSLLRGATAAAAAVLGAAMAYLGVSGARADAGNADVALVLGFALADDGSPRPQLIARVREASALYRAGRVRALVLSGGAAKAGRTEGSVMRELALSDGVPEGALILEPRARSTIENFACAQPLIDQLGAKTVFVVTEPWHMTRSMLLARRDGYVVKQAPATSEPWRNVRSGSFWLFRDAAAYLAELAREPFAGPGICESPSCDGCRTF